MLVSQEIKMDEIIKKRIDQINCGEVPRGYKKTEVGIVPTEWDKVKLKDLLDFKNGINAEKSKFGSGIKLISIMDILQNKPIYYEDVIGAINIDADTLEKYSVTYGDILFQRSSENFEDAGKSNVYLDEIHVATYSGFVIRGKKISEYNPFYLNLILKIQGVRKQIVRLSAGSQHINIGQDSLSKIVLNMPDLIEQQKIATILSTWDKAVDLQEKLLEKLEVQKKALMQKLLTPKAGWTEAKFKEIYRTASEGGTPSTLKSSYYKNGKIPFVKIEHLSNKYIETVDSFITEEGMKNSSAWLVPKNSLIFSNGATIGETAINKIQVTTKQGILSIVPKENILVEFLYYYLSSKEVKNKIRGITTKGTMSVVYLKDLDKLVLLFPNNQGQKEIAEGLSSVDSYIVLQTLKLKKLKIQQKAIRQLLLTGIVRVN